MKFSEFMQAEKAMGIVLTIKQYEEVKNKIKEFYLEKDIEHIEDFCSFKYKDTKFILCNRAHVTPMMYLNAVSFIDRIPFNEIIF